jgi:Protein of unknown function (DUF3455)
MLKFAQSAIMADCLIMLSALFGPSLAGAQKAPPSDAPSAIQVPTGEKVVLSAHASGSQVYTCQGGAEGKFAWTLKGPDAHLMDRSGKVIGRHFDGPTWKLQDGSEVTGKAVAHADSPDADSVAWLLVNVVSHSGSGALTEVNMIQRVHTHGGKPPAQGCDQAHSNAETRSSYTADYYFYAPSK